MQPPVTGSQRPPSHAHIIAGPAPCQGCGAPVYLARGPVTFWAEPTGRKWVPWLRHECRRGARCGTLMPGGDHCARRNGHQAGHRSRYALDCAAARRRAA